MNFEYLPLNTSGVYTRGIDKSGCQVWIPALNVQDAEIQQTHLQTFLTNQPEPKQENRK